MTADYVDDAKFLQLVTGQLCGLRPVLCYECVWLRDHMLPVHTIRTRENCVLGCCHVYLGLCGCMSVCLRVWCYHLLCIYLSDW